MRLGASRQLVNRPICSFPLTHLVRCTQFSKRQAEGPACSRPGLHQTRRTQQRVPRASGNDSEPSTSGGKRQPEAPTAAVDPVQLALTQREEATLSRLDIDDRTAVQKFLYPDKEDLTNELEMPIWDHLEELRERALVAALAALAAVLTCFCFSKELVVFLEAPVAGAGVRFLQLSPGEFFFTTLKVAGYAGLLTAVPTVLYEVISYVLPGLTKAERNFLAPIILGSSVLFYCGLAFSYEILTPAALNFFVSYSDGAVESLWSIDQYFEFVLVLMLSTGLSFQVPVIQVMLGQLGIITSDQMFGQWRYVVVGATIAAAVLTPSTDPFTQSLLAAPLIALYFGGASVVRLIEGGRSPSAA